MPEPATIPELLWSLVCGGADPRAVEAWAAAQLTAGIETPGLIRLASLASTHPEELVHLRGALEIVLGARLDTEERILEAIESWHIAEYRRGEISGKSLVAACYDISLHVWHRPPFKIWQEIADDLDSEEGVYRRPDSANVEQWIHRTLREEGKLPSEETRSA